MYRTLPTTLLLILVSFHVACAEKTDGIAFFEKQVRPLLIERCLKCHSSGSKKVGGNLLLDSRDGWMKGGDLGPAIDPGNPDNSLLIKAIRHSSDEVQMPPDGKISKADIATFARWIELGAPDPREGTAISANQRIIDIEQGREFWAFQPPAGDIQPPLVRDIAWPINDVDRFILAALEKNQLAPAATADKLTLIRRVTFDLIGLPPTPGDIQAFVTDDSDDAYRKVIDRLLDSPRYGERWGRHWLDVARYSDSNGLDENIAHGNAWRYRDYVIKAFNDDKPYDQFVTEQLAGDLLPDDSDESVRHQRLIATGFLSLGPKVLAEVDETKMEMDIIDEQIETVGRTFMGLTLGCARCHDHKFDPITTKDYYALAGIFKSTKTMEHFTKIAKWHESSIETAAEKELRAAQTQKIDELKKRIESKVSDANEALKKTSPDSKLPTDPESKYDADTKKQLAVMREQQKLLESSLLEVSTAMGVVERETTDVHVHIRGNHLSQGDVAQRGFPTVFVSRDDHPVPPQQSGRRELANWLVSGKHPLTARVMVNRIWRWHFGRGLVESTDNLGKLGKRPQNQELLDWLCSRFVRDGWSVKSLHRLICLSSTYRTSSSVNAAGDRVDPANRLHWRANMSRLDAESIRDSMLTIGGLLDETMGGSLLHVKNREFIFNHTSKDETKYDSNRRSIYLPVIRNHLYEVFQLFDYSDASVTNSDRPTTTVAPQALFMLNSEFAERTSAGFAKRVMETSDSSDERIAVAYQLAFGRPPTKNQIQRDKRFLEVFASQKSSTENQSSEQLSWQLYCQMLLASNEFIYVR
ncbi:MAG: hypothetical protein ACI9G1_000482 [Pirellulaceae bacterium]|jgi:hypothetical protein